jgi:phage tail sheath protein FI
MPEYLAPGVYVEEIETGSKPIEGVSTSTAGLVGVTERGPAHVPLLVTSFGDYFRLFGGSLDAIDFVNPPGRGHYFLPHAVEGFFVNGGKRTYVTRVIAQGAARAQRRLFFLDTAVANVGATHLLRPAEQGTGTAVNQPPLYVLGTGNMVAGEIVRVGDGSRAEYHEIAVVGGNARHVTLSQPLSRTHPVAATVHDIARTADPGFAVFTLAEDLQPGARTVLLQETVANDATALAALPGGMARLEIGAGSRAEFNSARTAAAVGGNQVRLTLVDPVMRAYPAATAQVTALQVPAALGAGQALAAGASAGETLIVLDTLAGAYNNTARLAIIAGNTPDEEIRRIGALGLLDLDVGAYEPCGTAVVVERVTLADDNRQVAAGATTTVIPLNDARALAPGMTLTFVPGAGVVSAVDLNTNTVTLQAPLPGAPAVNSLVIVPAKQLTAAAEAGTVVLSLNDRLGLGAGDVVRVGAIPDEE